MASEEQYVKVADDTGQEFYCPMVARANVRDQGAVIDDACVETDVAQRYSGAIRVVRE